MAWWMAIPAAANLVYKGTKWVKRVKRRKKLKSDSGTFKRDTKDNLYETSLVSGRLRGTTGKTVTKKVTHAEQAAVKKELDAANKVGIGVGTVLAGGVYSNQRNAKKRKENRKRANQIAHKKYTN